MEIYYNIHDILKIKANFEWAKLPTYFQVDEVDKVDVNIKEGKFDADFDDLRPLGLRLFKGKNFLVNKPHLPGDLKLKIQNLDADTDIYFTKGYKKLYDFYGSTVGPHVLSQTLSSILLIKFLEKGYTLIHSACVSGDSEGMLISAWGDTGKTFTSSSLIQQCSFHFLSDDLTLIDRHGFAYCFPQEMRKRVFNPFEKIPFLNKMRISKKVDVPKSIIRDKSKIGKLFFLEKEMGDEVKEIDQNEALRRLLISTASTLNFNTSETILAYSYLDNRVNLGELMKKHEDIIRDTLKDVGCFEVKSRDVRQFPRLIKEVIDEGVHSP